MSFDLKDYTRGRAMERTARDYAAAPDLDLRRMRAMAPGHQPRGLPRFVQWLSGPVSRVFPSFAPGFAWDICGYCGHRARFTLGVVNPISLSRTRQRICNRRACRDALYQWQGAADARRRRAQWDWEQEHPTVAAARLIDYIPPQYPSVSRATLRAFLESGEDSATVDGENVSATSLNGSIKSLGFDTVVFAEVRSGRAVLRRIGVA